MTRAYKPPAGLVLIAGTTNCTGFCVHYWTCCYLYRQPEQYSSTLLLAQHFCLLDCMHKGCCLQFYIM